MLYQFRRQLRVLAAAVLVSVSVVGGWSASTHGLDDHDADRAVGFVVHDASTMDDEPVASIDLDVRHVRRPLT